MSKVYYALDITDVPKVVASASTRAACEALLMDDAQEGHSYIVASSIGNVMKAKSQSSIKLVSIRSDDAEDVADVDHEAIAASEESEEEAF